MVGPFGRKTPVETLDRDTLKTSAACSFFRILSGNSIILSFLVERIVRLRPRTSYRASIVAFVFFAAAALPFAFGVETAISPAIGANNSIIVIGFVGGFVNHDNPHHGPVQLARRIRQTIPQGAYVRVFENRHRKAAYQSVVAQLDTDRNGILSPEEKKRARIVIFGHSWGASATVLLARELRQQGIPVLLTVQVDSVTKPWQNNSIVPDNVAEAVNFYQTQGILHGRREIAAADPTKTEIVGNYFMDYKKKPVECLEASWWEHVFTPGHMQSECDPQLWSQIEKMVQQHLSTQPLASAVPLADPPQSAP